MSSNPAHLRQELATLTRRRHQALPWHRRAVDPRRPSDAARTKSRLQIGTEPLEPELSIVGPSPLERELWVRRRSPLEPEPSITRPAPLDAEPSRGRSLSSLAWVVSFVLAVLASADGARADSSGFDRDADRDADREGGVDIDGDIEIDAPRPDDDRDGTLSRNALVDLSVGASPRLAGRAPGIAEVLEAAYAAAGLDREPAKSWRRRARVAALIPWVSVRAGWDANWREEETDVGRSRDFEVRATWRLDRLVFEGRELQIASIEAARRRERRRLASVVIRAYFTWRKLVVAARREARYGLAVEAAVAELDALTDGWFSDRAKSPR